MENEFVTYEQALSLKELGFDMPCLKEFHSKNLITPSTGDENTNTELIELYGDNSVIGAPLKQQAFRWFREKYKIQSLIQEYLLNTYMHTIDDGINSDTSVVGFETYEEAESACIDKLIELVKNK